MATSFTESGVTDTGRRSPNSLISADKVHGTEVFNHGGERLGTVDSIMIDKVSGEIAYVVMSFGGFLGIGEKYHPLPWDVLEYDTSVAGYRVNLDREALAEAPAYDRENVDSHDYDSGEIDDFYASTPRSTGKYDESNRSDANDGRERPLGYFSSQAQADRDAGTEGTHASMWRGNRAVASTAPSSRKNATSAKAAVAALWDQTVSNPRMTMTTVAVARTWIRGAPDRP